MADASYPDDLKYHPEHDWARVDGDIATLGITWYAQDQLGEVVFFDPPEVGTTITKDEPYAEVESVKAVSDVIAPVSGEIVEVNEALKDAPEQINEDSYGEGWLVKVRLCEPSELDELMDAESYQERCHKLSGSLEPLHVRHRRRPAGDARGDRRRTVDDLFADIPEGVRLGRALDLPPGKPSRRSTRTCATSPQRTSPPRTRSPSSAPGCTTTTSRADRLDPAALGVPDAVHALPARDQPGRAAGDVRVPDSDLRADRPAGLQRVASTRARAPSPPRAGSRTRTPRRSASWSPRACTRTPARRWRRPPRGGGRRSRRSTRERAHGAVRRSATTSRRSSSPSRTSTARSRTSNSSRPTRTARC